MLTTRCRLVARDDARADNVTRWYERLEGTMAQRVILLKTCDLDHDEENVEAADSVRFGVDGSEYEFDLCEMHAESVHNDLQALVSHARHIGGGRARVRRPQAAKPEHSDAKARSSSRTELGAVREWARANGHQVSDRGRIPARVMDAYSAAH